MGLAGQDLLRWGKAKRRILNAGRVRVMKTGKNKKAKRRNFSDWRGWGG